MVGRFIDTNPELIGDDENYEDYEDPEPFGWIGYARSSPPRSFSMPEFKAASLKINKTAAMQKLKLKSKGMESLKSRRTFGNPHKGGPEGKPYWRNECKRLGIKRPRKRRRNKTKKTG